VQYKVLVQVLIVQVSDKCRIHVHVMTTLLLEKNSVIQAIQIMSFVNCISRVEYETCMYNMKYLSQS
jgi:hypothetical protein